MEIIVEKDRNNPLLRRREIYFRIRYDGITPSRRDVREKIAGLFNASLDRIVINWIKPEFGKCEAIGYAKIYESADDMKSIESEHIIRRNFPSEEGE